MRSAPPRAIDATIMRPRTQVRGVPDYAAFVARPTCLERVEQSLKIGVGEIARAFEDDGQEPLKPYASAREFGQELRLVLENARAYNERFRRNPHNVGYNICLAVDAVQPVLEEALFQFAFEAYERVGRMKLENSWEKKVAEEINEEVAAKTSRAGSSTRASRARRPRLLLLTENGRIEAKAISC